MCSKLLYLFHEIFNFGLKILTDRLFFKLEIIHAVSIEAQQFVHAFQVASGIIFTFSLEHVNEELRAELLGLFLQAPSGFIIHVLLQSYDER